MTLPQPDPDALRAEVARIDAAFAAANTALIAPDTLIPADLVLDLYGEDIRTRAFLLPDPEAGELALRPDFTAPVAQAHLEQANGPARYRYAGPVFRRQTAGSGRAQEYPQCGIELIGDADRIAADAEVFALVREALGDLPHQVRIGDLAIAFAAIAALPAPQRWRDALTHAFWRPVAFRRLLTQIGPERPAPSAERTRLLAIAREGRAALEAHLRNAHREEGRRDLSDVADRIMELAEDADAPPLPSEAITRLEAVLSVKGPAPEALRALQDLALPELEAEIDALANRLTALTKTGHAPDPNTMTFDAAFGRALEYYDGFVFEFSHPAAAAPLGGGGRYDALMARLGGKATPAVGGVLRPLEILTARGGAA